MIPYHTIESVAGGQPLSTDHYVLGLFPGLTFAATANALTAIGAITAGSGFTDVTKITIAPTGGTGSGGAARATSLKAVSATVVNQGTSGFANSDTITLTNGVVLTVASVSSGKVATVTVSTPGSFTQVTGTNPVAMASTSGSGVGTPTFNVLYGLNAAKLTNSGNYSVVPTGMTVTDQLGVGSGASLAAPTLGSATGQVVIGVVTGSPLPPVFGVVANASVPVLPVQVVDKHPFGFSLGITPTASVVAGTLDAILFA